MPRAYKYSVIREPSIHSTALSPSRLLELVRQPVPVSSAPSSIPTPGPHACEDPLRRTHRSARYRRSISCPARSWKWCCTRSAHLCGLQWCRNRKSFHRRWKVAHRALHQNCHHTFGSRLRKENHSIRLRFEAIPKSQGSKTATKSLAAGNPWSQANTHQHTAVAFFYILFQTYIIAAPFE